MKTYEIYEGRHDDITHRGSQCRYYKIRDENCVLGAKNRLLTKPGEMLPEERENCSEFYRIDFQISCPSPT